MENNLEECPSRQFALLLLTLMTFVLGTGFITTLEAASDEKKLGKVLLQLHQLYLDARPKFERLRLLRRSDRTDEAQQLQETVKQKLQTEINSIENLLQTVNPSDARTKEQQNTIKGILSYFQEYQRKILTNWEAKNPDIYKALNTRELINKGYAKPETLRNRFLMELSGLLYSKNLVDRNPMKESLNRHEKTLRSMEKNVQKRFIKLLNQFDQAKEEENDEKKEKMLNEIRSSWKNLWDQLDKKQNRLRTSIDRQLQIFRNRDHLAAAQERDFEQARQLKKRFLELMEYRKRKDLFSDWEKSWSFLLFVTKQKLRRLISILERNTNTVFAFISKFEAITNRINKIKNEQTYKSHTQKINRMIDMMYQKNYGIVKASIENIQSISVDNLKSLSEYLAEKQKTKDEQKLAEITKKLTTYVQDVKQFADRAKGFPRKVQEKLNEKGFKSMKQFKELLSEIGLEKLKDLIEKNDQLAKEFFKLKRKTNSFLKSLRKKKASEEEEEKN